MEVVEVIGGDSPLILAMPHTGLFVPDKIFERLNENGKSLADTDWHIDKLYDGLMPGAGLVRALFHRYVIDANRAPDNESLYPGQNTTALCPLSDFDGAAIYLAGKGPGKDEIEQRKVKFHQPYHEALRQEIERVRARFGVAVLYDCHSIRSQIPFLFENTLPDFNIGTNNGTTCTKQMETKVAEICAKTINYTSVLNGRFKGGWTTRNYGQPDKAIHAIQMELAQSTHLVCEKSPFTYSPQKAAPLREHLKSILEELTRQALKISNKE